MVLSWNNPPKFKTGSFVSATAHLNALQDNAQTLLAAHSAPNMVQSYVKWRMNQDFGAYATGTGPGEANEAYHRIWSGWMRHLDKADRIHARFYVVPDSYLTVELRLNYGSRQQTVTVPGGSTAVVAEINESLSGCAWDKLYHVSVDVRLLDGGDPVYPLIHGAEVSVLYIREEKDLALTSGVIADLTVPSEAQLNAISDDQRLLYEAAQAPIPLPMSSVHHVNQSTDEVWAGNLIHRHNTLVYDIRLRPPTSEFGHTGTLSVEIYYDDTLIYGGGGEIQVTEADHPADSSAPYSKEYEEYKQFAGVLDLSSFGFVEGQEYRVRVVATHSGPDGWYASVRTLYLYEVDTTPDASGWLSMSTFAEGDPVSFASLTQNMQWLAARMPMAMSYAAHKRPIFQPPDILAQHKWPELWTVHRHKWLIYRVETKDDDDSPQPSIGFWYGDKWNEQSLSYEPYQWQVVDLSAIDGLYPGMLYCLTDVTIAFEDTDPSLPYA